MLLSTPLSLVFCPNEHPPSFNFQKACWDDFDSYCSSAEEYLSLFLSSAAALFTSLALNAAKSSIPFGYIKRHPKAWWSTEVEGAVSEDAWLWLLLTEVIKITRLTSLLPDAPRQSSPRPRLRHGRRLALLFHPKTAYSLLHSLAFLTTLLISQTVLLPESWLRFSLIT